MIKKIIIILLFFALGKGFLSASGSAGISGADFLELGVGSRPLSMGEAFTAERGDINSIYYNPAGLGTLNYPIISIFHQELIVDSRFENISFAYPLYGGFIGLSNSLFWVPVFDKIDIDGNKTGDVQFYNGNFTSAYGYNFELFQIGGSAKYIYQKIDTLFLHSAAFDMGILTSFNMYSPFNVPLKNFSVGMSFQNIGTKAKDDPLPRLFRLGMSYKLTKWFKFNADIQEYFIRSSDLYDFTYGFDESFGVTTGVEFTYLELISLRGGYKFNDEGIYSLGIGVNYAIKDVSFIIDTSYADNKSFGPIFSINFSFKLSLKIVTRKHKMKAAEHYNRGIMHFISKNYNEALQEFMNCKNYNPYFKDIDKKIIDVKNIIEMMQSNERLDEEIKEIQ